MCYRRAVFRVERQITHQTDVRPTAIGSGPRRSRTEATARGSAGVATSDATDPPLIEDAPDAMGTSDGDADRGDPPGPGPDTPEHVARGEAASVRNSSGRE
jgi:hypothetical protein